MLHLIDENLNGETGRGDDFTRDECGQRRERELTCRDASPISEERGITYQIAATSPPPSIQVTKRHHRPPGKRLND